MKIIVCIKQVPNTAQAKLDPETGTFIREGIPSIINPDDKHALQAAIRLKKETDAHITAVCMGPPQAESALREAFAMGCDEGVLISGKAFAGSDTFATSYLISLAIEKLGGADLIFCGRQAIDGDTAQVGPEIAEWLGIPQITYAERLTCNNGKIIVKRKLEDGYELIETKTPCLLAVIKELNDIELPSLPDVLSAYLKKSCCILTEDDFPEADKCRLGLSGSPTQVFKVFTPKTSMKKCHVLKGEPDEASRELLFLLKKEERI